jgi:acetate kinase
MKPAKPSVPTTNGGCWSIKFGVYQAGAPLQRRLHGTVDRIGMRGTNPTFEAPATNRHDGRSTDASDHKSAATFLMDWGGIESVQDAEDRVVHGTMELIETFRQRHPKLPQVACFDTVFHRAMPRLAKLFLIPWTTRALDDPSATICRVILADLCNGASMAATRGYKSIDTSAMRGIRT